MGRGARKPQGFRDVDGILLLNKPVGISSNKALQNTRFLFKANKAGHTGSLDPLASGVLPICFGEATKFSNYLLDASKSYRALCSLGKTTSTGDAEGEIISQSPVNVTDQDVRRVLDQFTGKIDQIPPMYSAVKHKGQRLYKLARKGQEIERTPRQVEIFSLELIGFNDNVLEIDVRSSKGTYIRTLAEDIGNALGCGAFLARLERTGVQPFWGKQSYSLDQLRDISEQGLDSLDQYLLPVNSALVDLPELIVDASAADNLKQGQSVKINQSVLSGPLCLVTPNGQFLGIGEAASDGRILPKRLMNTAR
jgi:tRNA pseudouridine55 synthase